MCNRGILFNNLIICLFLLFLSLFLCNCFPAGSQQHRSVDLQWNVHGASVFLFGRAVAMGNKDNEDPTSSDSVWNHQDIRPNLVSHYL